MRVGTSPMDDRSEMAPYAGTGRSVSTRVLATSVNIYKKVNKNLGQSTHTIGRTRSTHIMMPSLYGSDGATYVKAPTWDVQRVPKLYVSIMSSCETRTVPSAGSAS